MLLTDLLTRIAKLPGPGGVKAVVAGSLLMKQQLLVIRGPVHQSLNGDIPDIVSGVHQPLHAKLSNYSWISHCNGLIQTPIAA